MRMAESSSMMPARPSVHHPVSGQQGQRQAQPGQRPQQCRPPTKEASDVGGFRFRLRLGWHCRRPSRTGLDRSDDAHRTSRSAPTRLKEVSRSPAHFSPGSAAMKPIHCSSTQIRCPGKRSAHHGSSESESASRWLNLTQRSARERHPALPSAMGRPNRSVSRPRHAFTRRRRSRWAYATQDEGSEHHIRRAY